ncbi:hypothetical protein ACI1VL_25110, partial [Escherichia coli]
MNIAIVTINQENAAIASWLAAQDFSGCTLAHWQIEPQPVVAEQVLDALVEQWQRTPADVVLFPPGTFGDEPVLYHPPPLPTIPPVVLPWGAGPANKQKS